MKADPTNTVPIVDDEPHNPGKERRLESENRRLEDENRQLEKQVAERTRDLDERIKELNCLLAISYLIDEPDISLEKILHDAADLPFLQSPETTSARIIIEDREFAAKNFKETPWKYTAHISIQGEQVGKLEVYNLEERPDSDEGSFFQAEKNLIDTVAERLGGMMGYKRAEAASKTAREAAEAANKAKSVFLANMSHELRTPLNGILGYAQILKRDPSTPSRQQKGLDVIEQSGKHLLSLISDVMDTAKVDTGRIDLHEVDFHLPDLIRGVTGIIRLRATRKGISFSSDFSDNLPAGVHGDGKRLRQVLLNLLGNAVKFTDKGNVTLRVKGTEDRREHPDGHQSIVVNLRFSIEDTGIGISEEDLKNIFVPFRQVGDQDSQDKGTGLGLAISKNLVELMGSSLNVKSLVGLGSTFWFDIILPVVRYGPDRKSSKRRIIGIQGESPTVLVVDDSSKNRAVLVDMLSPLGFHVIEAINGYDGLVKTMENQPDVVISDLVMAGMDGYELIRRIRESNDIKKETVVIAHSASVYEEHRQKSVAMGSDAFLPKPVQIEKLLEQLANHLKLTWVEGETVEEIDIADHQIVFPGPKIAKELYELALIGDINELEARVNDLSDSSLRYFIMRIKLYLKDYQLDEISEWLRPHTKGQGVS